MNKGSRLTIKPATIKAKADGSPRKPARVEVLRQKRQTPVSRDTQTESPDGLGRVTKKHHQEASQSAKDLAIGQVAGEVGRKCVTGT